MSDKNNTPANEGKEQLDRLVRKADHLSNFGTLTSLISTAAYFVESILSNVGKKLPKWLNIATLSAVGVGIVSVISSYYYKLKAGRIALDSSAQNKPNATHPPKATCTLPENTVKPGDKAAAPEWAKEIGSTQGSPSEPGR